MDNTTKRKLKIVVYAFIFISVPFAFFTYTSILRDQAHLAYEKAILSDDTDKVDIALEKIIKAEKLSLFDGKLVNIKAQLLYQKKEYRKALKAIEKKEVYIYQALLYEHLGKIDSAKLCYERAIPELERQLKKQKDVNLAYQLERQIALFYTFLGQIDKAKNLLPQIPENYNPDLKELLLNHDFYIENYISGGYKDFLEGETIRFTADSIPENIDIDSLMLSNRFYANSSSSSGDKREFEIKKIFEQKAIEIGLKKIN